MKRSTSLQIQQVAHATPIDCSTNTNRCNALRDCLQTLEDHKEKMQQICEQGKESLNLTREVHATLKKQMGVPR